MFELIWAPIISGTFTGVAVALVLAAFRWRAKPRFELQKMGEEGYGKLINWSLRPILLGDSFCMDTQSRLLDPGGGSNLSGENSLSRLVVLPLDSRIVLLNGADLGHYVTFTYRPLWRASGGKNYSELGAQADEIGPFGSPKQNDKRFSKWREHSVLVSD
ncbi:hypothetical protein EAH68_12875 [Corynebacterium hylobatis]|uniref:Uncharacterized protein n=1 Tax=Corynebacterium hylobatis TaxID=1859290 RepID=A0A3S0BG31_9CORY|nr:hypothetical protein [Corynebacterium hylobatis]RSZ61549.1 hypothetical protein EAH68_12875 [Corynebacterium hylobatis]